MSSSRRRLCTECLEARDVPNATITGSTFEDANLDGSYAQAVLPFLGLALAENAVAGVTVELDLGGDGTFEQTTTSDSAGEYRLTDVPDGNHTIRASKAGFVSTTRSPNSFRVTNGIISNPFSTADIGPDVPGQLLQIPRTPSSPLIFGLVRAGGIASGTVYFDVNGNGKPDAGDTGISRDVDSHFNYGVTVFIFDAASKVVATPRTNSAGNFAVASLPDGKYTAVATSYADRRYVVNGPATFTIAGGKAVSGLNIQLKAFGEISGQIFKDTNADGIYQQRVASFIGGPAPETILAGATVTLDLNNDGTIDRTTTSDANGKYTFGNVSDGSYTIATSLAGYTATRSAYARIVGGYRQPNPIPQIASPPEGFQPRVGVLPGSEFVDLLDLGLTKSAIVALGTFNDANQNGVQEFDERGIPNATIQIDLDSNGSVDLTKTTTQTGTSS